MKHFSNAKIVILQNLQDILAYNHEFFVATMRNVFLHIVLDFASLPPSVVLILKLLINPRKTKLILFGTR